MVAPGPTLARSWGPGRGRRSRPHRPGEGPPVRCSGRRRPRAPRPGAGQPARQCGRHCQSRPARARSAPGRKACGGAAPARTTSPGSWRQPAGPGRRPRATPRCGADQWPRVRPWPRSGCRAGRSSRGDRRRGDDSVDARDQRELFAAGVVRAVILREHPWVQATGQDLDDALPGGRVRIVEALIGGRRAEGGDDGCLHDRLSVVPDGPSASLTRVPGAHRHVHLILGQSRLGQRAVGP